METYMMGYKYRIYPNKTQANLINRTLGSCRFVFNHFLAVRRDQWDTNHQSVTYKQTAALLTDLKRREETCWLKEARWERRARSWDGAGGHRSSCPKGRTTPGDRRESPTTRVNPADGSEIVRVN